jgi:outer membrane protein assembly factor BamB
MTSSHAVFPLAFPTLAIALAGPLNSVAADWPSYRGATGDGMASEPIRAQWPATGLKRVWRVETPGGFSSFAVAGDMAFTVISRNLGGATVETCVALDANTGKELWAAPTGPAQYPGGGDSGATANRGGDGPRSTPAVDGPRVYVYSSAMVLHCLDANSGRPVWKKDIIAEHAGRNIGWKSALSPVIEGDLVLVAGGGAGQAMLAFHKKTGAQAWKSGDAQMTHATPVVATLHGVRQAIFFLQSGLAAVNPQTGESLWDFPFPYRTATACSPVVAGDTVFCTAGYEVGGGACVVSKSGDGFEAREVWRRRGNAQAASLWSTPVHHAGHLYGMISFKQYGDGPLKCLDLRTGEVKWQQPGFGAGNVILAGQHLIALSDDGHLALVEATPAAYREVARFKALDGKCWTTPALANGRLYVRSTKEGACFELPPATASR